MNFDHISNSEGAGRDFSDHTGVKINLFKFLRVLVAIFGIAFVVIIRFLDHRDCKYKN